MNNNLNIWVAKYKARVRNIEGDGSRNTYSEYPITEQEYAKLKLAIADKEPFTWIHDLNWNKVREINAKRDIKDFLPVFKQPTWYTLTFTCSFWEKHPIVGWNCSCDCSKKYWCLGIVFLDKINLLLGLDISNVSNITKDMRKEYLSKM